MGMAVRICVCGDEGMGKSSLITSLVKDIFVTNRIQSVLPPITLPPGLGAPDNVTTTIIDTSALPHERTSLRKEVRKSNCILLVYSDHYSYERVALFWMPYFRSLGVNVPVVLCANKSDLAANGGTSQVVEDEMLPVMAEFKEIDSCIRTSAREHHNINEVFFLCQKAVTHPIAPLFDSKESTLKPAAVAALHRIFYLCDKDHDGILNDSEIMAFQEKVFERSLSHDDLLNIKRSVHSLSNESAALDGIDKHGFVELNKIFVEKGRHETLWMILRKFNYTDSLSLKDTFLHPKFDVPQYSSAELSPAGYRFFVDLFLLFDKDNDGGLNDFELQALFSPTPGLPPCWVDYDFPSCTVRNDAGYTSLQGWLAQWSMTTFHEPKTTLEYLAYLGFETPERGGTIAALKITKARKRRRKPGRVERNVFLCYILGASHSGKSCLLSAFLNRPFSETYHPTIRPRIAVNSVELPGGKQCYLILEELGELESAILENQAKLDACDTLCYTYDSSDPDSFTHIVDLRKKYSQLDGLPVIYAALKADQDKTVQRSELQPDQYTNALNMAAPLHVSVTWGSITELFVHLAESATYPSQAFPKNDEEPVDRTPFYIAAGAPLPRPPGLDPPYLQSRRRAHVPQISISDESHHVTEAIGDMYGDSDVDKADTRPLSFFSGFHHSPVEVRKGSYFDAVYKTSAAESLLSNSTSSERYPVATNGLPKESNKREPSIGSNRGQASPPILTRNPSSDTASQHFPLNDIDYESSPEAVAQELSNLQAIRRMSMNVDAADPDLPTFSTNFALPTVPPSHSADEDDASRLFWVPARLHPELAPKEFKTFVEDRVDRIRRRSGEDEALSPDSLETRGSGSSLARRKSMLSKTIISANGYKDGADLLERKRSQSSRTGNDVPETTLEELEFLVNDPASLVRKLSIDAARTSLESSSGVPVSHDMPILPPTAAGQSLKRSTRTTYRRGSLRRGDRTPFSRRVAGRMMDGDSEDPPLSSDALSYPLEALTYTVPSPSDPGDKSLSPSRKRSGAQAAKTSTLQDDINDQESPRQSLDTESQEMPTKSFQSRLATNGRTTAPLPGFKPPSEVPQIVETPPPPDSRPVNSNFNANFNSYSSQGPPFPERNSSHEFSRQKTVQHAVSDRAAVRPAFSKYKSPDQTLDDMAKHPSPMLGNNTSTDALSFIPTFTDDKRSDRKTKDRKGSGEGGARKTSWGWLLGSEDKDKEKDRKEREEREAVRKAKSKQAKITDKSHDLTRSDVLQTVSESPRGRESIVLDRESFKFDEERKKDQGTRKSSESVKKEKSLESGGIFSSLFGGGKKKADRDSGGRKGASSFRGLSPELPLRSLRADIDYNWTRFSILEERAIYRMAHIKLANPRRALYSQVLLSNFMYSYLAKVQQMHPQIQIPTFVTKGQGGAQKKGGQQGQEMDDKNSDEYAQWQGYQDQQQQLHNNTPNLDGANSSHQIQQPRGSYNEDYGPEHQAQEDARTAQYSNGYHEALHQQWENRDQRKQYAQQGLFDNTRPPEDGDMW